MNNEITRLQRIENIVILSIGIVASVVVVYALIKLGAFVGFAI